MEIPSESRKSIEKLFQKLGWKCQSFPRFGREAQKGSWDECRVNVSGAGVRPVQEQGPHHSHHGCILIQYACKCGKKKVGWWN